MKIRTSVITTTLAAFAAASPLSTSTDGAQNEHSLETRGEKTVMKITLCNNCIGGGRISCNLGHYAYWTHGDSKEGHAMIIPVRSLTRVRLDAKGSTHPLERVTGTLKTTAILEIGRASCRERV